METQVAMREKAYVSIFQSWRTVITVGGPAILLLMACTLPFTAFADPYSVLGSSTADSFAQIRIRYLVLVKRYHPDPSPEAQEKMKLINAAFDEIKRAVISSTNVQAEQPTAKNNEKTKGFRPRYWVNDPLMTRENKIELIQSEIVFQLNQALSVADPVKPLRERILTAIAKLYFFSNPDAYQIDEPATQDSIMREFYGLKPSGRELVAMQAFFASLVQERLAGDPRLVFENDSNEQLFISKIQKRLVSLIPELSEQKRVAREILINEISSANATQFDRLSFYGSILSGEGDRRWISFYSSWKRFPSTGQKASLKLLVDNLLSSMIRQLSDRSFDPLTSQNYGNYSAVIRFFGLLAQQKSLPMGVRFEMQDALGEIKKAMKGLDLVGNGLGVRVNPERAVLLARLNQELASAKSGGPSLIERMVYKVKGSREKVSCDKLFSED